MPFYFKQISMHKAAYLNDMLFSSICLRFSFYVQSIFFGCITLHTLSFLIGTEQFIILMKDFICNK